MQLLEEIEKIKDMPVIVEGKRDRIALKKLGFSDIHTINRPIFKLCEDLAIFEEVVILTDLDKEGRRLYSKIKSGLERCGVKVNNSLREFLFRETDLSHIEGLDTYLA